MTTKEYTEKYTDELFDKTFIRPDGYWNNTASPILVKGWFDMRAQEQKTSLLQELIQKIEGKKGWATIAGERYIKVEDALSILKEEAEKSV